MSRPDPAFEPSMEDILASIRKIIAEEPATGRAGTGSAPAGPGQSQSASSGSAAANERDRRVAAAYLGEGNGYGAAQPVASRALALSDANDFDLPSILRPQAPQSSEIKGPLLGRLADALRGAAPAMPTGSRMLAAVDDDLADLINDATPSEPKAGASSRAGDRRGTGGAVATIYGESQNYRPAPGANAAPEASATRDLSPMDLRSRIRTIPASEASQRDIMGLASTAFRGPVQRDIADAPGPDALLVTPEDRKPPAGAAVTNPTAAGVDVASADTSTSSGSGAEDTAAKPADWPIPAAPRPQAATPAAAPVMAPSERVLIAAMPSKLPVFADIQAREPSNRAEPHEPVADHSVTEGPGAFIHGIGPRHTGFGAAVPAVRDTSLDPGGWAAPVSAPQPPKPAYGLEPGAPARVRDGEPAELQIAGIRLPGIAAPAYSQPAYMQPAFSQAAYTQPAVRNEPAPPRHSRVVPVVQADPPAGAAPGRVGSMAEIEASAAVASALGALAAGLASSAPAGDGAGAQAFTAPRAPAPQAFAPPAAASQMVPPPLPARLTDSPAAGASAVAVAAPQSSVISEPCFFIGGMGRTPPPPDPKKDKRGAPPEAASAPAGTPAGPAVETVDETVADLLRPMLRQWLSDNMPRIVEKALRIETTHGVQPATDPSRKPN